VGELRKLGIEVAKSTVEKYRVRSPKPSSPTWKAFLHNHVKELVSIDFFMVPTLDFKVLPDYHQYSAMVKEFIEKHTLNIMLCKSGPAKPACLL
jgi:hypothetical protein